MKRPGVAAWIAVAALLPMAQPVLAQRPDSLTMKVTGEGPNTFVLLTGVIGGVYGFRQIESRLLKAGKRVVIIDPYRLSLDSMPVSFDAMARRVSAVLLARGITSATLVGHAHGGGVALRLAAEHGPVHVAELFLLNVGAIPDNRNPVFSSSLRFVPLLTHLPRGRSFVRGKIVAGIRENTGHSEWLDERTAVAYTDPLLDDIGRIVTMGKHLIDTAEPEPLANVIARLDMPVTLLIGAMHCPASPNDAEIEALAPLGSRLSVYRIAGACHFPHEEAPDDVLSHLLHSRPR